MALAYYNLNWSHWGRSNCVCSRAPFIPSSFYLLEAYVPPSEKEKYVCSACHMSKLIIAMHSLKCFTIIDADKCSNCLYFIQLEE